MWRKVYNQRCPRVILEPDNRLALEVATATMSEETAPLAPLMLLEVPEALRGVVVRRVMRALNSERVVKIRREIIRRQAAKAKRSAEGGGG